MTLPYDYARCVGVKYPLCTNCRRREPGSDQWQAMMSPPFNWDKRTCHYYIAPLPPVVSESERKRRAVMTNLHHIHQELGLEK